MLRAFCKSKIHRATVTRTELHYEGSVTIDRALLLAADLLPFERVDILNLNNGERLTTYCIPGKKGSGVVCLNGAASRQAQPGDQVIILAYGFFSETEIPPAKPKVVKVDGRNRITKPGKK